MIADIASGNVDTADIFFLIAVIMFVVYAVVGFLDRVDARIPTVLLGLGLACTAVRPHGAC